MDQSLFQNGNFQPLASRMRPQTLDEFVGQTHLLGKNKVLSNLIEHDEISSMIFWVRLGLVKPHWRELLPGERRHSLSHFLPSPAGLKKSSR